MLIMVETRSKHCILSLIPTDTTVMLKYMYFNLGKRKCTCRNNFYLFTFFQ